MPRGTIDREQTFRYDLKSLPAQNGEVGGFVVLRRLTYHEMMTRRDISSKIGWEERRSRRNRKDEETIKAMMEVMNVATMEYEFKNSIVEHNIENENGSLLDFTNPESYRNLNPLIGSEIGKYIDELNQEPDTEEMENFPTPSKQSFGEETTLKNTSEET